MRLAVRWQVAILLCLITTINYVDRQAFAVAAPVIVELFSLTESDFGAIGAAFLFAYGIGHVIAGPIIDRIGTKRAFSIAVVAWSIAGMLCAAGRGFWSFLGLRSLLGFAEAANFPAALKSVAEWFPERDRSLAVGIVTMGPGLGALIAPPLLGWLIISFGWQWAFLVPGAAGFLWLWIWQRYYHAPADHPTLSRAEADLIAVAESPSSGVSAKPVSLTRILWRRDMSGLMLSRFFNDGAFYFYVAWLPLYLAQERGFDIRQIALFAWIPFLAADIGSFGGGWLGRRLIASGMSVDRSRKLLIWLGALLVVLTLPAALVDSPYLAIALIGLAMLAIQGKAANLFALPADLYPPAVVGTSWGWFGAIGALGGACFNYAAGWTIELYGYSPVFIAVGATQLLSAIVISVFIPRIALQKI